MFRLDFTKKRHKIIGPSRGEIYMSLIGRLAAIEEFPKKWKHLKWCFFVCEKCANFHSHLLLLTPIFVSKFVSKQKERCPTDNCEASFGGLKRIRTAVRGFADLCLATRPSDHFPFFGLQIYTLFCNLQNFCKNYAKKELQCPNIATLLYVFRGLEVLYLLA